MIFQMGYGTNPVKLGAEPRKLDKAFRGSVQKVVAALRINDI